MGSLIRWLLIALGIVAAAIGILLVVLMNIDPNKFKPEIIGLAKDQGGLNLQLDGDLAWQFWPNIGLRAAGVTADWAEDPQRPLVQLDALTIDVAVLPLLSTSPTLQVNGVALAGADIYLVQEKNGRTNWEPPTAPGEASSASASGSTTSASSDTTSSAAAAAFAFDSVAITESTLTYEDRMLNDTITLKNLELTIDGAAPGATFPIALEAFLEQTSEANGPLEVSARATLADDASSIRLAPLDIEFVLMMPDTKPVPVEISGEVTYDINADSAQVSNTTVDLAGLAGTLTATARAVSGDNPKYQGSIEFPRQSLTALAQAFDPSATGVPDLGLSATFDMDNTTFNVDPIKIQVDQMQITGNASGKLEPRTSVNFNFASEEFNVAWLAAPGAAAEAPAEEVDGAASVDAELLPLDTMREVDWNGTVTVAKAIYDTLTMEGFKLTTSNRRGQISADLSLAQVMSGDARLGARIDARRDNPSWQIDLNANDLDSKTLLADLDRIDLTAKLSASGQLTASGNSEAALADSLNGNLNFDGGEGRLDISAIKQNLATLGTLLSANEMAAKASEGITNLPEVIEYRKLAGVARINGLPDQDIAFQLDNMDVTAKGGYDIRANAVDYRVALTLQDQSEYQTFNTNQYIEGVAIPARCRGSLDSTDSLCSIDAQATVASVVRSLGTKAARGKIDSVIDEKVPEEFRDAAKSVLDLFGGKKKD